MKKEQKQAIEKNLKQTYCTSQNVYIFLKHQIQAIIWTKHKKTKAIIMFLLNL